MSEPHFGGVSISYLCCGRVEPFPLPEEGTVPAVWSIHLTMTEGGCLTVGQSATSTVLTTAYGCSLQHRRARFFLVALTSPSALST